MSEYIVNVEDFLNPVENHIYYEDTLHLKSSLPYASSSHTQDSDSSEYINVEEYSGSDVDVVDSERSLSPEESNFTEIYESENDSSKTYDSDESSHDPLLYGAKYSSEEAFALKSIESGDVMLSENKNAPDAIALAHQFLQQLDEEMLFVFGPNSSSQFGFPVRICEDVAIWNNTYRDEFFFDEFAYQCELPSEERGFTVYYKRRRTRYYK